MYPNNSPDLVGTEMSSEFPIDLLVPILCWQHLDWLSYMQKQSLLPFQQNFHYFEDGEDDVTNTFQEVVLP